MKQADAQTTIKNRYLKQADAQTTIKINT